MLKKMLFILSLCLVSYITFIITKNNEIQQCNNFHNKYFKDTVSVEVTKNIAYSSYLSACVKFQLKIVGKGHGAFNKCRKESINFVRSNIEEVLIQ